MYISSEIKNSIKPFYLKNKNWVDNYIFTAILKISELIEEDDTDLTMTSKERRDMAVLVIKKYLK